MESFFHFQSPPQSSCSVHTPHETAPAASVAGPEGILLCPSLEDAVAKAEQREGCTVRLLRDVTTQHPVNIYYGSFVIDLNGHIWRGDPNGRGAQALHLGAGSCITMADSAGGGTFTSSAALAGGTLYAQDASVFITGGTYECTGGGWAFLASEIGGSGKQVCISGGTFKSAVHFDRCAHVLLSGGTFSALTVSSLGGSTTIGQLLAPGCGCRSAGDDSVWISVPAVSTLANVTVQPLPGVGEENEMFGGPDCAVPL